MLEECLDNVSRNKLIKAVPEVNAICEGVPSEQIVIYGAGNIGKKAYALYKDSVLYYADQNPLLYGKKLMVWKLSCRIKYQKYKANLI